MRAAELYVQAKGFCGSETFSTDGFVLIMRQPSTKFQNDATYTYLQVEWLKYSCWCLAKRKKMQKLRGSNGRTEHYYI